jgi:hypothetical protein
MAATAAAAPVGSFAEAWGEEKNKRIKTSKKKRHKGKYLQAQ